MTKGHTPPPPFEFDPSVAPQPIEVVPDTDAIAEDADAVVRGVNSQCGQAFSHHRHQSGVFAEGRRAHG